MDLGSAGTCASIAAPPLPSLAPHPALSGDAWAPSCLGWHHPSRQGFVLQNPGLSPLPGAGGAWPSLRSSVPPSASGALDRTALPERDSLWVWLCPPHHKSPPTGTASPQRDGGPLRKVPGGREGGSEESKQGGK